MNIKLSAKIRVLLGVLAFLAVFEFAALAMLAAPKTAEAVVPVPVTDAPVLTQLQGKAIVDKIQLTKTTIAKMAFFQALLNATTYFFQKIAYDTAIWASTGFQGQNPFAYGDNWYDYIGKEGLEAVGEFVGSLSEGLGVGLGLCDPNLSIVLKIQLGLLAQVKRPQARCSWNQIQAAYSLTGLRQRGTDALRNSGLQFEPGQAPLSVALQLNRQVFTEELKATNAAINERLDQGPFRAVTDSITGRIKTPSAVVQNRFDAALATGDNLNKLSVSGAYMNSEVGVALAQTVISTFVNTLASQLLDKVMGGFFPISDLFGGDPLDVELAQPTGSRLETARQLFAGLQVAPIRTIERFDLLGEFTSCPDNPGPMNCVVDEGFAAAVRQASAGSPLTLRDALEQNPPFIRGDWPLWPPSALDKNQDQNCYRNGFCYANLVKLRRARIIPVGWELAAARSDPSRPVTLNEVIAGYNNCTEDGTVGDDEQTRWCHLIDPNWVLKYPPTQCRQLGPGATLIDPATDSRAEVCVDMPSCNATDEAGNCLGGWGYCTRERNLWRFDGEVCPAQAASCQVMQNSADERIAALTNTVDFGVCSADNAGCRWYSTLPDPENPLSWNSDSRLYLNGRAPECDEAAAGCTELVPKRGGVTFNLARNSSFEQDSHDPSGQPDFWDGAPTEYGVTQNFIGGHAVRLSGSTRLSERITVSPNQFYTMSFHAKRAGDAGRARMVASLRNASGDTDGLSLGSYFVSSTCSRELPNVVSTEHNLTADYARYSCTFTTPARAAYLYLELSADSGEVWFDAVQLEENEFASAYTEGRGGPGAADRTWLRIPPSGLCAGGDDDPAICDGYAPVCAATDVGCEQYSPVSGEPGVTGIAREADACDALCVGYETFREEPTNFNPDGDYPLYFIPTSATRCSVANAGCDEFTNLDAGAGAEQREYFTFLRLCEEPAAVGDDTATYYTWEGTEAEGFQLRVWQFKSSNLTSSVGATDPTGSVAPCTAYNAQTGACRDDDGLEDDEAASGDGSFEPPASCNNARDIFTNPDCREFYDVDGNIHYRLFSRTILKTTECTDYRKTLALGQNPPAACNDSGGRWQASTHECFYRANVPTSTSCPAQENQCRLYTGNTGRNVELVFEDNFEDGDTAGWTGGVISSESLAATGQSMRKADGATLVRTEAVGGPDELEGRTLFISFWARGTAGRNLEIRFENAPAGNAATPAGRRYFSYNDTDAATPTAALTGDWRFFELGPVTVDWNFAGGEDLIISAASGTELFIDNIRVRAVLILSTFPVIRDSWETPPICDATSEGAYSAQEMLGCETYRDRASNEVHLRSFSRLCSPEVVGCEAFFNTYNSSSSYAETWNFTCLRPGRGSGPCSIDPDGATGPAQAQQVCVIPTGRDRCQFKWDNELVGAVENLARFTPPISLPYIGDTIGTDADGAGGVDPTVMPFFVGSDAAIVPADSTVYVVDDPAKHCQPDLAGCLAVGLPTFDQELRNVTDFESVHRMNLPDRYNEFLCTDEALFCDGWRDSENTEWYFKNPQGKTCEWREAKIGTSSGWFRTDTDEPCYENFVATGNEYGIWNNRAVCALASACTNASGCPCPAEALPEAEQCRVNRGEFSCSPYHGWVGVCEEQHNACTEFLDPADTAQNELTGAPRWSAGRPHYFIDNDRLDESLRVPSERCEGQVSLNEGCVLFNDTSESVLSWNSAATYWKSEANNFGLVSPVNCESPSPADSAYCKRCATFNGGMVTNYCSTDDDCDPIARSGGFSLTTSCTVDFTTNDSNRILKVRRDRECAEWLACDQPEEVWDSRTSERKTVCSSLDVCDEALSGGLGECRYVIDKPTPQILDADRYARRDTSWQGRDYSGYSIPGEYPVDALEPVNVGVCVAPGTTLVDIPGPTVSEADYGCNEDNITGDDNCPKIGVASAKTECVDHFRLGRVLGPCNVAQGANCIIGSCPDGSPCNTGLDCGGELCDKRGAAQIGSGWCYSGQCAQPPSGPSPVDGTNSDLALLANTQPMQCRIYPEVDSPFPNKVLDADAPNGGWNLVDACVNGLCPDGSFCRSDEECPAFLDTPQSVINGFQNAKLCGRGENCECSYQRVSFEGRDSRYYSQGNNGPSSGGLCTGGENTGIACNADEDCGEEGDCSLLSRSDRFIGLSGFCLEPDRSQNINGQQGEYGCLTWYPVDRLAGVTDLYNQFASASWDVPVNQQWYCAQGSWSAGASAFAKPTLTISYDHAPAHRELVVLQNVSHRFFDEPNHVRCDPLADDWNTTYGCIGTDADHLGGMFHHHGATYDCGENDGGEWCLWPQYECSPEVWGPTSPGHSAAADNHAVTSPNGRCARTDNWTGPWGVTNFLGCYEITRGQGPVDGDDWDGSPGIKETGIGTIRYPWIGPDVHPWQVREFEIEFGNADDAGANPCRYASADDDDGVDRGDSIVGFRRNDDGDYTDESNPPLVVSVSPWVNAEKLDVAQAVGSDGTLVAFYPVWDALDNEGQPTAASKLRAMTVLADDNDGDSSLFFIQRFAIRYWPACYAVARVGDDGAAAFTDRVVEGNYDYPPAGEGGFTRETGYAPWGATCVADGGPSTLVVNEYAITPNGVVDAEVRDCSAVTDALYRDIDVEPSSIIGPSIRQLFARSGIVRAFLPVVGADTHEFFYDVGELLSDEWQAEDWAELYRYDDYPDLGWDDTERADSGAANAPKVRAAGLCEVSGLCEELDLEGLTLEGGESGTVRGVRQKRVGLKFFAYATKNRMPLGRVVVDWGDQDQVVPVSGLFKNHRGRGKCTGAEFGLTGASCEERPFTFSHDYRCTGAILEQLPYCSDLDTEPGGRHVGAYQAGGGVGGCRERNACVYVPRVMVVDNWGWCTGDCPDAPGRVGCYDGSQNIGTPTSTSNECKFDELPHGDATRTTFDDSVTDPWVYFNGKIVVEVED